MAYVPVGMIVGTISAGAFRAGAPCIPGAEAAWGGANSCKAAMLGGMCGGLVAGPVCGAMGEGIGFAKGQKAPKEDDDQ